MKKIDLQNYAIYITEKFSEQTEFTKLIDAGNYSSVFILADANTAENCMQPLIAQLKKYSPHVIRIAAGEDKKNITTCGAIWQTLVDKNADRKSLLINMGGGVIGDMGGFAASTFKRGFDFINVPTTLLSQVDASVGGKLGIDFNDMKNLIGVFNNPKGIFIATEFLLTLPSRQMRSGFAEVLKHGLISDKTYWNELRLIDLQSGKNDWVDIIAKSVEIKRSVVLEDMYEAGMRKILNFGHTIGHAVETYSLRNDKDALLHGEAIAIGMICEAFLAHKLNGLKQEELEEIVSTISRYFPKYAVKNVNTDAMMQYMLQDKKNTGDKISFSLLYQIGECDFDKMAGADLIHESLTFYDSVP